MQCANPTGVMLKEFEMLTSTQLSGHLVVSSDSTTYSMDLEFTSPSTPFFIEGENAM